MASILVGWCPHGDKPLCYIYKVRLSGLADFSLLRKNSTDVYVRAGIRVRGFADMALNEPILQPKCRMKD